MKPAAKRVLIVDDDNEILIVLKSLLEAGGYEVTTADGAKVGVQQAVDHPPDVIILDVMMPEINGMKAARMIRTHPRTATTPIILLTALDDQKYKKTALFELDVEYFLTKPCDHDELLDKVHQAIRYRRKPRTG